eukprot:5536985-Alexandrium_andersonii.AAC.1
MPTRPSTPATVEVSTPAKSRADTPRYDAAPAPNPPVGPAPQESVQQGPGMADPRLWGTGQPKSPPPRQVPAFPASTVLEWSRPSTAGVGATVSGPIFTPQGPKA